MKAQEVLLALVGSVVCGNSISDEVRNACTPEMLEEMYPIAARHTMEHLVGHAISKMDIPDCPAVAKYKETAMRYVYNQLQLDFEYERISRLFTAEKIPFIPLKGTVVRQYYPEFWMRHRCDVDILVKEEHLDTAAQLLIDKFGYISKGKHDHDISFRCPSGAYIELHYDTIQKRHAVNNSRAVLKRIWEDAQPVAEGQYQYMLSDEMFYFYHIAHMAKHFTAGGCGIRTFQDIWLLRHKVEYDPEKRNVLLQEGDLLQFAQAAESVSECWFSGKDPEEMDVVVSDYVIRGNQFEDKNNRAALGQVRYGGRLKYLLTRRVFLRYDYLKVEYPILKKHKWLMPVYQVVRWSRMLNKGVLRRATKEISVNMRVEEASAVSAAELVKYLGL